MKTANSQLDYVIVFILTVKEIYADMTPDRQKIYTDLTKTALGATEQTTNRLVNNNEIRMSLLLYFTEFMKEKYSFSVI